MGILRWLGFLALLAPLAAAQGTSGKAAIQPEAWQIMELANQARAAHGAKPLQWDPALAEAARQHCLRMAEEGPISHRYGGEPDLTARAGQAGAHFDLIEENVALGPTPAVIHDGWMHSTGHRTNLLNPDVDHVGVAVVAARGVLYAVADYSRGVKSLTSAEVETRIATILHSMGLTVLSDSADARAYCANNNFRPANMPGFRAMWQDSDATHLPDSLIGRIRSRQYHQAQVGSCAPQDVEGAFTTYRVAVLLY